MTKPFSISPSFATEAGIAILAKGLALKSKESGFEQEQIPFGFAQGSRAINLRFGMTNFLVTNLRVVPLSKNSRRIDRDRVAVAGRFQQPVMAPAAESLFIEGDPHCYGTTASAGVERELSTPAELTEVAA
jgi:hypothetical protein